MNSDIVVISKLDVSKLRTDLIFKLKELCKQIIGKDLEDISSEHLDYLLSIDINTSIESINIHCQETRQVAQYSPNSYSASQTISLKGSHQFILETVKAEQTSEDKITKYAELKSILYKYIQYKYSTTEDHLRSLILSAEEKDGAPSLGRHSS